MKTVSAFLLCGISGAIAAAPSPKPDLLQPGIYTADTTISMAPPRTTAVLVEPSGEIWAGDYQYGPKLLAFGEMNLAKALGKTKEIPDDKLDIRALPTPSAAAFASRFTFYDKGTLAQGFHTTESMGKRSPFDVPLIQRPNFHSLWTVPSNNYVGTDSTFATGKKFSFNVSGVIAYGIDGDCLYSAKWANTQYQYKKITVVYTADCYRDPYSPQVKKGTMYTGVLFPMQHPGLGWNGFMIYLKGERENKGETYSQFVVTSIFNQN